MLNKKNWLLRVIVLSCLGGLGSLFIIAQDAPQSPPKYPAMDFKGKTAYKVVRIVDGDTLYVSVEDKDKKQIDIRLKGIDTPETVAEGKPVEPYGKEASAFLANLLQGEYVYMEYEKGTPELDDYKRTLAYLYRVPDGMFVNLEIVRQGYGRVFTKYEFKYKELFTAYETRATESKKGLWSLPENAPKPKPDKEAISWQDAGKYVGKEMTVEGLIVHTYKAEKACFLDFSKEKGNFYVVIFPGDYAKFSESPEKLYADKKIKVKGLIKDYKGTPEIIVSSPDQIEIVKD